MLKLIIMARRRSRRSSRRSSSTARGLTRFIQPGSFLLAFVSQLTEKDIQSNQASFNGMDLSKKFAFIANTVVGRISGVNLFSDMPQVKRTFNPAGIVNNWTTTGLGILILNKLTRSAGLGTIVKDGVGKGLLKGGAIGGVFDDPAVPQNQFTTYTQQNFGGRAPSGSGFSSGTL